MGLVLSIPSFTQKEYNSNNGFLLLNYQNLKKFKVGFQNNETEIKLKLKAILNEADYALTQGPFSVTYDNENIPPSKDLHDYISQSRYYWRSDKDSTKYIYRDGYSNPEIYNLKDHEQMQKMIENVTILSFAYYITENEKYFIKATNLLKVWFINDETKMNPNLNYAQRIPGKYEGTPSGIIDGQKLIQIPDAYNMLCLTSKSNMDTLTSSLKTWFYTFAFWLENSDLGIKEKLSKNNHGTYYDLQIAVYYYFSGSQSKTFNILSNSVTTRIENQFNKDGSQPYEMERNKSLNYSVYNILAFCHLANFSNNVIGGTNLWIYKTSSGKKIENGILFLIPYLDNKKIWKNKEMVSAKTINSLKCVIKNSTFHQLSKDIDRFTSNINCLPIIF